MQFWNEIIHTAALGTGNRQVNLAALPFPLQQAAAIITERSTTDKEDHFLQLAALSFHFRRGGTIPLHQPALDFPQAPPETLPYCTPHAAQLAKDIMGEDNQQLLHFWLDRCVNAQKLAPPDIVPALLNRAVHHKNMRQAVTAVCGKRGEWMSRFNSDWTFSAAVDDDEAWQTGTPDQRKIVLWRMRQVDPAKTRGWLLQTWPQENANSKVDLLRQLNGTVQADDETWLMDLLNEKSQKVRDEALGLLKQLPGSALVKKYIGLLQPLVVLRKERGLLGMKSKTSLQILPPVIPEKGEYAPGIDKLSNDKTFSDGEFVINQLIQHIPPGFWEEHLALAPADILALFSGNKEKYLPAFVNAAVRFRDQKWVIAYLEHREVFYAVLLDLLPPSEQDAYCLRNFKQNTDGILQHARQWDREWSPALAKEIVAYTAKLPYQYNIAFYKTNIQRIPTTITGSLDGFGSQDPNMRSAWNIMTEQISHLLQLKAHTEKAFNE